MFTVTVPQIKEYKVCELYYKLKYLDEETVRSKSDQILLMRYEETLKRIITHFFYKRQGYQTPTYNQLLTRWEKLWFPKGTDAYDIATERHQIRSKNLASYTSDAATSLLHFYNDFEKSKEQPLLIKEDFLIPIDREIRLAGSFDLVLRQRDDFRVILFTAHQARARAFYIVDFAAQKIAFNHRNKDRSSVKYQLYQLASKNPGASGVMPLNEHIKMVKYWSRHMANNKLFVPRRGDTVRCKGCPFDKQCREYKLPDEEAL